MAGEEDYHGDLDISSSSILLSHTESAVCKSDVALNMADSTGTDHEQNPLKDVSGAVKITRKYVPVLTNRRVGCGAKRGRYVLLCFGGILIATSLVLMVAGTIRFHQCQEPEMPSLWGSKQFHINIDKMVTMNNYALESPTGQSSTAVQGRHGYSELAVDGDLSTCSRTDTEVSPWWRVDLGRLRPIHYILVQGRENPGLHDIVVYLESEDPLPGRKSNRTTCHTYNGVVPYYSFLTDCNGNANARYVIIQHVPMSNPDEISSNLVLCEVMVTQR